jgi:membrane-anchored protein YejM (alkaline phosphatase superfamily)
VQHHYETHIDIEQHALQLLQTDQGDFVFLHLEIPHSPNIWNRRTGQYVHVCGSSYVDNLALADRELGLIMDALQSSPRWKDTTLIVQGDHSWRIPVWYGTPWWTGEDHEASHDVFDTRPALLIHRAGETQPETVSTPWPLLRVHDVMEQVLKGQPARP